VSHIDTRSAALPDRPGLRFGALVGGYVAALTAPALTLLAVAYFDLRSSVLAFAVLGTVGVAIGSGTAVLTADDGRIAAWLNSGWVAWLFALLGLAPTAAYSFSVLEAFATYLVDPAAIPVSSLVGTTGFVLGIVACVAGEIAVRTARNRVASSAVASEEVLTEWTAGWPRAHRVKLQALVLVTGLVTVGTLSFWSPPYLTVLAAVVALALVVTVNAVLSDRVYRLTPTGLEHRRSGSGTLFTWSQFVPTEQIEHVAVSEDEVVVHRSGLLPSVRFDRRDLRLNDEEVISSLDAQFDTRR